MQPFPESDALLAVLRQSAKPDVAAAIERPVREAPDQALARINVLAFAGAARPGRAPRRRSRPG